MVLTGILLFGFAGIVFFSYDKRFQVAASLATGISYVAWGVVHHYLHRDFHLEVLVEYMAVAVVGLVVLFSLILQ